VGDVVTVAADGAGDDRRGRRPEEGVHGVGVVALDPAARERGVAVLARAGAAHEARADVRQLWEDAAETWQNDMRIIKSR
jgi:hypothetical protein